MLVYHYSLMKTQLSVGSYYCTVASQAAFVNWGPCTRSPPHEPPGSTHEATTAGHPGAIGVLPGLL